jgi:hypothetical protein
MQGRFLDEIRSVDSEMVTVRKVETMVMPAYTGSTTFTEAKPTTKDK